MHGQGATGARAMPYTRTRAGSPDNPGKYVEEVKIYDKFEGIWISSRRANLNLFVFCLGVQFVGYANRDVDIFIIV
jgi:hypothetical protein